MEKENLQHVQLPHRKPNEELSPKDQLIYLTIKRHESKESGKAYPSQEIISKESGASAPTLRKSIKTLEKLDYFKIEKDGRKNVYVFNPYKSFEPFDYKFLDNPDLTFTEKAYLVSTQQFMLEKETGFGKIAYSNNKLSKLINMPISTISKCNRSLQEKQFVTVIDNNSRDPETGCKTTTKIFDFDKFGNEVVKVLVNHEQRIDSIEDRVARLEEELRKRDKTIAMQSEQLAKEQSEKLKNPQVIL